MPEKKSKIYLVLAPVKGFYKVTRLVNRLRPEVGSELSEGDVKILIGGRSDVFIDKAWNVPTRSETGR